MLIVRGAFFLLLFGAAVLFGLYAATGHMRYRELGWATFKWTLLAAAIFFMLLIVQRLIGES